MSNEPVTPPPTAPVVTQVTIPDTLYSQAFIYALCMLPLAAGPTGYFFGAAKHPTAATQAVTTTTPPPVVS